MQVEFNKELSAKLRAAGFNEQEMKLGAMMAELHALMKLISHPLTAMAATSTFAKLMAILSEQCNVPPQRICAASNLIFDFAMGEAKRRLGEPSEGEPSEESATVVRRMSAELDDTPATDPKDIN